MFTEAEKLTRIITSLASESLQNLCGHNCAVSPAPTFGCDVKFSKLWTFDNGAEVVCGYRVASPFRQLRSSGGAELRNSRFQRSMGNVHGEDQELCLCLPGSRVNYSRKHVVAGRRSYFWVGKKGSDGISPPGTID
jgi:hypothetical protein